MSNTSMTQEFALAVQTYGLTLDNLEKLTLNAIKSAFLPFDERIRLIYDVVKPGYDRARAKA
jgi:adenosine deaminase